jgi:iron complex transport system substrate-binding protein
VNKALTTTIKSRLLAAAAAVSVLALGACGQAPGASAQTAGETVTIKHAQGTTEVPANPETVYTFDLGVLDSLEALGLEADGVPQAEFPQSLAKYEDARYTRIGSMKEPDFEAVSAGNPDLIIISGRTAGAYEELAKIAPTIDLSVDQARPLESFTEQARNLGRIFGREDTVAQKLDAIDARIANTQAKAADAGKGLVILTSGGEVTAYSSGSRFGLVHDVLGVPAASGIKAEGAHGESVSFEFVRETNPDLLFVVDRDAAMGTEARAASAVLDNDLVKSTNAAKDNKIVPLDAASWYLVGYGLGNLPAMIDDVASAL